MVGGDAAVDVSGQRESAGAAERLSGDHPTRGHGLGIGAEDHALCIGVVVGESVHRGIGRRLRGPGEAFLRDPDALQQRDAPVVVLVHAHAEVDLVGVGVPVELVGESKNRIVRRRFYRGEQ